MYCQNKELSISYLWEFPITITQGVMQTFSRKQVHAVNSEATDAQASINTSTFSTLNIRQVKRADKIRI